MHQFVYSSPMMPTIGDNESKPPTLNSHVLAPFKQGAKYTDTLFNAAVIKEHQGAGRRMTMVKYADDSKTCTVPADQLVVLYSGTNNLVFKSNNEE